MDRSGCNPYAGHAARIVVDNPVWIARRRGLTSWPVVLLERLLEERRVVIGDLVLAELLQGSRDDLHDARIERAPRRC